MSGVITPRFWTVSLMIKWTTDWLVVAALIVGGDPAAYPQTMPATQPGSSAAGRHDISKFRPGSAPAGDFATDPRPICRSITDHTLCERCPCGDRGSAAVVNAAGQNCTPPSAPDTIVELARALKWNPDLIYEYVHDNIQTIPIYDSLKGPLGTLIDGAGTPVDQTDLMFSLLQQSCYSPQYKIGAVNVPASQLTAWLGMDNSTYSISYALGDGGFYYPPPGSPITSVDITWMWIGVPISGTTYYYDPAGKTFPPGVPGSGYQTRSSGIPLATAMGYTEQPSTIRR